MFLHFVIANVLCFQDIIDQKIDAELFADRGCKTTSRSSCSDVIFTLKPLLFTEHPKKGVYYTILDDYLVQPQIVCFDTQTKEPRGPSQANAYLYDIRQGLLNCVVDGKALNYIVKRFIYFLDTIDPSFPPITPIEVLNIPPNYSRIILCPESVYCCFTKYAYDPNLVRVLQTFLQYAMIEIQGLMAAQAIKCQNVQPHNLIACIDLKMVYLWTLREVVSYLLGIVTFSINSYQATLIGGFQLQRVVVLRWKSNPTSAPQNSIIEPQAVFPFQSINGAGIGSGTGTGGESRSGSVSGSDGGSSSAPIANEKDDASADPAAGDNDAPASSDDVSDNEPSGGNFFSNFCTSFCDEDEDGEDEKYPEDEKIESVNPSTRKSSLFQKEVQAGTSTSICGGIIPSTPTDYSKIIQACNKNFSSTQITPIIPASSKIPLKKVKPFCQTPCDSYSSCNSSGSDFQNCIPFLISKPQSQCNDKFSAYQYSNPYFGSSYCNSYNQQYGSYPQYPSSSFCGPSMY